MPEARESNDIAEKSAGIPCPKCGSLLSEVLYTRPQAGYITRRRQCRGEKCGERFTTNEKIPGAPLNYTGIAQIEKSLAITKAFTSNPVNPG